MILLLLLIFSSFLVSLLSWLAVLLRPPDNVLLDLRKGPPSGESKVLLLTGLVPLLKHELKIKIQSRQFSTWFVQLQTNKFQGLFNNKLQFFQGLRFIQYFKNWHSLTTFWTLHAHAKTCQGVLNNFYFFSHSWSCYFLLFATTILANGLQLHLKYRNSIWNKETEIKYCSCVRIFLCYPWCLLEDKPNFP